MFNNTLMAAIAFLLAMFFGYAALTMAEMKAPGVAFVAVLIAAFLFATSAWIYANRDKLKA